MCVTSFPSTGSGRPPVRTGSCGGGVARNPEYEIPTERSTATTAKTLDRDPGTNTCGVVPSSGDFRRLPRGLRAGMRRVIVHFSVATTDGGIFVYEVWVSWLTRPLPRSRSSAERSSSLGAPRTLGRPSRPLSRRRRQDVGKHVSPRDRDETDEGQTGVEDSPVCRAANKAVFVQVGVVSLPPAHATRVSRM